MLLLRSAGGTQKDATASEDVDIEALEVEEKYKRLLRLCVKLTENAYKVVDEDIDGLREAGLSDEEILEGVFVACMFNAIDRMADTFGLYHLGQLMEAPNQTMEGGSA